MLNTYVCVMCVQALLRWDCTGPGESTPKCSGWWRLCLVRNILPPPAQWFSCMGYIYFMKIHYYGYKKYFLLSSSIHSAYWHAAGSRHLGQQDHHQRTEELFQVTYSTTFLNDTNELGIHDFLCVCRCLAEPVLTYRLHKEFIKAASKSSYCPACCV